MACASHNYKLCESSFFIVMYFESWGWGDIGSFLHIQPVPQRNLLAIITFTLDMLNTLSECANIAHVGLGSLSHCPVSFCFPGV